jgi:hypothetical protein
MILATSWNLIYKPVNFYFFSQNLVTITPKTLFYIFFKTISPHTKNHWVLDDLWKINLDIMIASTLHNFL